MKAKDFFRCVRNAESELKVINAKIEHFHEIGISFGSAYGSIGSRSKGTSRVELAACGAVDASMDLEEQRREFMAIIARAEHIIQKIPQEKYRRILDYHYICGKSFRWISDELEYNDPNSVYRAHGWALQEAQKIMNSTQPKGGQTDGHARDHNPESPSGGRPLERKDR